jgi:tetratricopeptide (TPR) repeat protein
MSVRECFISYSNADGLEFATQLADSLEGGSPPISVWFDKREISASGGDWDDQISSAIRKSKYLLFVMSVDSTAPGSNCKDEWTWALKYKKPVLCLLLDTKAEDQFRLNSRQKINFITNFNAGMAQLRKAIARLNTPEGVLDELQHRLADAMRDLRRATLKDQARIQSEIETLNVEIRRQEEIIRNPKAAETKTQRNIETGIEQERKPATRTSNALPITKIINPPPGIAPNYFQDRQLETREIIKFLEDGAQRMMTIAGRGGVGKTTMVCRLLKGLERGELPDGLGAMKVEGIVYLSESGNHRANFTNIYYDLCKLLSKETVQELDSVYKNPNIRTENKMHALLENFNGRRVILLLDNFDSLVDTKAFAIRDVELDEALHAFLNGTHTAVNIIVTTRIAPRTLNLFQPGRQRILTLDEGLESPYAENILREMDGNGRMGLKSAPSQILTRARERTRGYPRALEALFAILASDHYTTLEELLSMPTPENVVEALVGEAYNRLDTGAQNVMQALAIYNRPVTPAAVDYLLASYIPTIDSALILQRLATMHFARKERGKFYLHPVDRDLVFDLIPELLNVPIKNLQFSESVETDSFTRSGLTSRAADYFRKTRKSRDEWKRLDDLIAQLAEFDLRYAVKDYDTAASVLTEFDKEHLILWGHYHLMIEMHERIRGKITQPRLRMISLTNLGLGYHAISQFRKATQCYQEAKEIAVRLDYQLDEGIILAKLGLNLVALGDAHKAIECYQKALNIAKKVGDKKNEGRWYGNLGGAYAVLSNARKAIEFRKKALSVFREIKYRQGEGYQLGKIGNVYLGWGNTSVALEYFEKALNIAIDVENREEEANQLGKIGNVWSILGDNRKAIEFYQKALSVSRRSGNRNEEEIQLGNIGAAYAALGAETHALKFFRQSLAIAQEIGDRKGEGNQLGNLGNAYVNLGNADEAVLYYEQALAIAQKIGERRSEAERLSNLGNINFYYLGEIEKCFEFYNQALLIRRDIGDRRGESAELANYGYALMEKGSFDEAIECFISAISIADDIKRPQTQKIARSGLAEAYLIQSDLVKAHTIIEAALQYDVPQFNHTTLTLQGIVTLRQGDERTAQQAFEKAIKLSDEILAIVPGSYSALDAKELALCGSALCLTSEENKIKSGKIFFKARNISLHAGAVKRVLRLFGEIKKCDSLGILEQVRNTLAGSQSS